TEKCFMAARGPGKTPRIPRLCLHKATGQAVVRLGGKDVSCGWDGSAEAQATYDRLIGQRAHGGLARTPAPPNHASSAALPARPRAPAPLTVSELILAYKTFTDDYYRDSSSEREKIRLALRPLRRLYGGTPAAAFGPLALKGVRQAMLEPQKRTV